MTYNAGDVVDAANFVHADAVGTALITAATNFTDSDSYGVRWGPLYVVMVFINTTSAITVTSGNITDVTIGTTAAAWRPPKTMTSVVGNGSVTGEATLSPSGTVSFRAASDAVAAGTNLRAVYVWLAAPA